ncbi:hypothetical protein [Raoultella ornithinolytica]|uniref:hypothetical protein n=1 Tax=Raoultella ornithinolytica TaxID=54291 RepID=UPI00201322CA|nr:hypothetical protein [Raoultella ornithinolytica]
MIKNKKQKTKNKKQKTKNKKQKTKNKKQKAPWCSQQQGAVTGGDYRRSSVIPFVA